ncbi:hypothetical protein ACFSO0_03560 [Brevibacillus sp. GCM10020057]|uniref:hypothetical protein n=1 Tax=Brevibacillus sp. GCM10020057 TaxID=3317327 RepID=UPI00362FBE83
MKIVKDERGGALLIVFMILVLFTALAYSLANHTMQSVRQRTFSEDEVQGKLLADAGLAYFQEYLEANLQMPASFLTGDDALQKIGESLSTPNAEQVAFSEDKVIELVRRISSDEANTYKEIRLPGMNGSFAIQAQIVSRIPRETGSTPQPYVLQLKVSVIGIPDRAENLRKVKLTSTVYVNTVPAPFHYAVSTPGQLRLFGGSNIIGNIAADSVVTSSEYRYSTPENDQDVWDTDLGGLPYVEGEISLPDRGNLQSVDSIPEEEPDSTAFSGTTIADADLEKFFVPSPLDSVEASTVTLSADPATQQIPGYEPPIVTVRSHPTDSLFLDDAETDSVENTSTYVREQIQQARASAAGDQIRRITDKDTSLWFKGPDDDEHDPKGETSNPGMVDAEEPDGDTLLIESPYGTATPDFLSLTARFTGRSLQNVHHLYIGGKDSAGEGIAAVEMGRIGSFLPEPNDAGDPFTFDGTIYIKGNLDIVGDVSINGTIYVDGNVVIREIRNVSAPGKKNNLVIIASGTISLTDRYKDQPITSEAIQPLSAFLYSESAMQIYSTSSHNRLIGGIATGRGMPLYGQDGRLSGYTDSYIELNTRREGKADRYASHMSISFDRNIFDEKTPGLPPGDRFHIDLYDKEYPEVGNPVIVTGD